GAKSFEPALLEGRLQLAVVDVLSHRSANHEPRRTPPRTTRTRTAGIQRGDKPHHQDQAMTLVNLRTRKTTKRMVARPGPSTLTVVCVSDMVVDPTLLVCLCQAFA